MALANSARAVGASQLASYGNKGSVVVVPKANSSHGGSSGSFYDPFTLATDYAFAPSGVNTAQLQSDLSSQLLNTPISQAAQAAINSARNSSSSLSSLRDAVAQSGMDLPIGVGVNGVDKDNLVDKALSVVSDLTSPDRIASLIGKAIGMPVDMIKNSMDIMANAFPKATEAMMNGIQSLSSSMSDQFSSFANGLSGSVSSGFGSLGNAINQSAQIGAQSNADLMRLIQETSAANNAWSAAEAQKNRDWQEMMSNTAHQREVADLEAAGLNPVLSVSGGSGAPTGSGAVAQVDNSNTRLLAEVSMQALEAAQLNAEALGRVAVGNTSDNLLGKVLNSRVGRKVVDTAVPYLTRFALKGLLHV